MGLKGETSEFRKTWGVYSDRIIATSLMRCVALFLFYRLKR